MVRKSRKSREEWKIYNNVFDQFTTRLIHELSGKGYFKDLKSNLGLGKEANVFLADKDDEYIIVKIYRLENANFNKMYSYINADPRFTGLENQRRKIIFTWAQREYRNLMVAREYIRVPLPIGVKNHVLMMESIGGLNPSPMLKDKFPEDPESFYKEVLVNVKGLLKAGLVHGDLSEFNILNHHEKPVFIDFSQGTSIKTFNAWELLERDLNNVNNYFSRKKVDVDKEKVISDFKKEFDKCLTTFK